ncbi:unnamed protein product [Spirodela intermedia]|uniref:Protein kinase domain-containing protein n=1 Tax=Spirodela intermedia TaxID=51605 RepID=A0A7I8I936_SPIIN|nr:unnamed protein product [Spirodela intermedia]CAA6653582.1 unnamed protein product [Spirodela intermedia]
MAAPTSLVVVTFFLCFILFYPEQTALGQAMPAVPPSQQRLTSGTELAALYSLRSSLGLRSGDWPRKVDPCAGWAGVRCRAGHVVGLELPGLRRTRVGRRNPKFAVDGIQNLSFLVSFNASGFALPGPFPDWFGPRLPPSLSVLDLRHCSISGSIPSSLGNAAALSSLYVSGNLLTGRIPPTIGDLSNLTVLDLSGNALTGSIPATLGSLAGLTFLELSGNFLAGPIPPEIGKLSKLVTLRASNNSLAGAVPAELGDLSSLVTLDLSRNSLSGRIPEELKNLQSLLVLDVSRNSLSDALPDSLFRSLRKLQSLYLNNNNFSETLASSLWTLSDLRLLDASYNNFSGRLPDLVVDFKAGSGFFNISHNSFFGSVPIGEGSLLKRFDVVDISDNYFQGQAPLGVNASFELNCFSDTSRQRSSTTCAEFYAERGLAYDGVNGTNSDGEFPRRRRNVHLKYILAGVLGGVALGIVLVSCHCDQKKVADDAAYAGVGPGISAGFSTTGTSFTYEQILRATSNFSESNLMKRGHSGDLYRGTLEGGAPVVMKRIDLKVSKKDVHQIELDFFSKASHTRLVPFLGRCLEKDDEKILVYKFTPNGDLSTSLHWKSAMEEDGLQSLDWITRMKIAIGIAEALCYLHHECSPPFVHRDIQASSILLDDKFEVRVGSMSEVCHQEGDAHQNILTRFLRSAPVSCAYDVYCLGKVLLELVTGELGASGSDDTADGDWLERTLSCISVHERELVAKIVDPSLIVDDDLLEEVWAMAIVAKSCMNPRPSKRPLAKHILRALESPLKVVREDHSGGSARLGWRHSSSDITSAASARDPAAGLKLESPGDRSFSRGKPSKEIFPEPTAGDCHHDDLPSLLRREFSGGDRRQPEKTQRIDRLINLPLTAYRNSVPIVY